MAFRDCLSSCIDDDDEERSCCCRCRDCSSHLLSAVDNTSVLRFFIKDAWCLTNSTSGILAWSSTILMPLPFSLSSVINDGLFLARNLHKSKFCCIVVVVAVLDCEFYVRRQPKRDRRHIRSKINEPRNRRNSFVTEEENSAQRISAVVWIHKELCGRFVN